MPNWQFFLDVNQFFFNIVFSLSLFINVMFTLSIQCEFDLFNAIDVYCFVDTLALHHLMFHLG